MLELRQGIFYQFIMSKLKCVINVEIGIKSKKIAQYVASSVKCHSSNKLPNLQPSAKIYS